MTVTTRRARPEDIPFLGWVMYRAAQSHLQRCPWSAVFDLNEEDTLALLERVARSPEVHWCHASRFRVAEVDGRPAAAMSGFEPATEGTEVLAGAALTAAGEALAFDGAALDRATSRLEVAVDGLPADLPDVWGIENVAVLPEFRGRGLIDCLFTETLQEGRERGLSRAQVLCLIGNEHAQRAWERNGFRVLTKKTSDAFGSLIGTSGARLLARDL